MSRLPALREAEAARILSDCTRCGACVSACPMLPFAPAAQAAAPEAVVAGVLDLLSGGAGTEAARAWTLACTRSASCDAACPHGVQPMLMQRLAKWRGSETGALPHRDARDAMARVKAFARLTLTAEEQARWL